jgi:hypothetical protein
MEGAIITLYWDVLSICVFTVSEDVTECACPALCFDNFRSHGQGTTNSTQRKLGGLCLHDSVIPANTIIWVAKAWSWGKQDHEMYSIVIIIHNFSDYMSYICIRCARLFARGIHWQVCEIALTTCVVFHSADYNCWRCLCRIGIYRMFVFVWPCWGCWYCFKMIESLVEKLSTSKIHQGLSCYCVILLSHKLFNCYFKIKYTRCN